MRGTLIVTNDFPPRQGRIQSFVYGLACLLPPDQVAVYAPAWDGAKNFDARQPFPVIRHPTSLMLPVPSVRRRAVAARTERPHRWGCWGPPCAGPVPPDWWRSPTGTKRAGRCCPAPAACCAGSGTASMW